MISDTIVILRAEGKKLAKTYRWLGDGWASDKIDSGYLFSINEMPVSGLQSLHTLLKQLIRYPERAVVRGELTESAREKIASGERVRRLLKDKPDHPAAFRERERYWVAFDIDTVRAEHLDIVERPVEAINYAIEQALPPCFHDVSVVFQWTGSAAIRDRITTKCRLWFWLDQPLDNKILNMWMRHHAGGQPLVDLALFNPVQLTYTAAPVLKGAPDPIRERLGLLLKASDTVTVPLADLLELHRQGIPAKAGARGEPLAAAASHEAVNLGGGLHASSVEEALNLLGDGDGRYGFHGPLLAAGMAWARSVDPQMIDRQRAHVIATLKTAIYAAPKGEGRDVSRYLSEGYLNENIDGALQRVQAERLKGAGRNPLPGQVMSLKEAERLIQTEVEDFFQAAASAAAAYRSENRVPAVDSPFISSSDWDETEWDAITEADVAETSAAEEIEGNIYVPQKAIAAMVGLGKTQAVLVALAARPDLLRDYRVHLYAPDNKLVGEIYDRARAMLPDDISIKIRRGRTDTQLGEPLCRPEMHARADLVKTAGGSVSTQVCPRCPYKAGCTWMESLKERGTGLRIMPHAYLTDATAFAADIAIIDESFVLSLAGHVRVPMCRFDPSVLPEIPGTKLVADVEELKAPEDLQAEREALRAARQALWTLTEGGSRVPFLSELKSTELTLDVIRNAKRLEDKRAKAFRPELERLLARGSTDREIHEALLLHNRHYGDARAMAVVWKALEKQWPLQREQLNGWTLLSKDGQNCLEVGYRASVKGSKKPALILDATADDELLRLAFPNLSGVVHVRAHQPYARIVQMSDTLMSMSQMSPKDSDSAEDSKRKANNIDKVVRIATAVGRNDPTGLITYKGAKAVIDACSHQASGSHANLRLGHFGAVRGRNTWQNDPALVVAGRPRPDANDLTRLTAALFFDKEPAVALGEELLRGASVHHLIGGTMVCADEAEVHPNPACERVRRQVTEAELCQAIGRARGVRRTEQNPVQILVLTSVPLPMEVDHLVRLSDIEPTTMELIAARDGVYLAAPRHAYRAFQADWSSVHAAEKEYVRAGSGIERLVRGAGHPLKMTFYKEMSGTSPFTPHVYKLAGPGQRYEHAWFDLARIPDPALWLKERLGKDVKIRAVRIVEASASGSARSTAVAVADVIRAVA